MRLEAVTNLFYSIDKTWLSEYKKELIAILMLLALSLLYYKMIYSKKMSMIERLDNQVMGLKREIEKHSEDVRTIKERADEIKRITEEVKKLERRFLVSKSKLPSERQLSAILKDITRDEIKGDIEFMLVKPMPLEDRKEYFRLPFNIDLQGPFFSIAAYLKRLEDLPRIINVENLRMDSGRGTGKIVKVQLYASTFVLSVR